MRYHRLAGFGMGELGFNVSNAQRHECEKRGGVYSYKPGARYPGAQGTDLCDGKVMFTPQNTIGMPHRNLLPGQVAAGKMSVQQEQFNNGCNPAEPAGGICPQAMTTWWTVREGSSSGRIVHADKDEGKARTWASQFEAQAGPKGDKNDLMPEPTAIDMPAPGRDIDQGPAVSKDGTILGMKPQTALLGAVAAVALFMISKG